MASLTPLIISPKQANDIYSRSGFPKQRHVFLVRFNRASTSTATSPLTYAVKTFDRPAIQPVVEEVNQYNKKRQIYTGYKKSPVKCSFYDDAKGSALTMWAAYSRYYFGDFNITNNSGNNSFSDDIISDWQDTNNSDFGLTARNGTALGGSPSGGTIKGSQWFFKSISILHFHNNVFDQYTLINPRIASFAPDELDYEQGGVAMINAEFVYEALIFNPNTGQASSQPEFTAGSGADFNGETDGTDANYNTGVGAPVTLPDFHGPHSGGDTDYVLQQTFGGTITGYSAPNYNYYGAPSAGGLSAFGNFIFGRGQPGIAGAVIDAGSSLAALSASNPALAATLGIGYNSEYPLSIGGPLSTSQSGFVGLPSQFPGVYGGVSGVMRSTFGAIGGAITTGILAAEMINGSNNNGIGPSGLSLSAQAYSVMNSQNPGSTQYGYNAGSAAPSVGTPTASIYADYDTQPSPASLYADYDNTVTPASLQPQTSSVADVLPTPPIPPSETPQTIASNVGIAASPFTTVNNYIDYSNDASNDTDPDTGVAVDDGTA